MMATAASGTATGAVPYDHVLVTGGSGFLGRALSDLLPGARALASSDVDLTDGGAVADAIDEWRPEVVVHLAARVGGITANIAHQADFLVDNLRMDSNLLAALRQHRPRHMLAMLSTCMYPDELPPKRYPMTENEVEAGPPPPTNAAYASAKRALWHGVRALHEQYGVPYTALVPCNLYGPGDHFGESHSHFLAAAVHKIEGARLAGDPTVEFFGTGSALRQYVFVHDLARLVAHLVDVDAVNDTLNVAPDGHWTVAELAVATAAAAGYEGDVVFTGEGPDGQHRKDVTAGRLLATIPSWRLYQTDLDVGLRRTIDWYRHRSHGR
jgi:GDP-L-fucose synthase